jgi:serine protease
MRRSRVDYRWLASALVALALWLHPTLSAQRPPQLGPGVRVQPPVRMSQPVRSPLRLTADRVDAYLEARARGWNFLPGEVIVQFKPGMSSGQQQRALGAIRSRPSVDDLRWVGDMAVLRDPTQPNSRILAEQLSEQPEVEFAQPNYFSRLPVQRLKRLARPSAAVPQGTPNDTYFSRLQWNFSIIGLPSAWDINAGGSASVIVAIVDTGITTVKQNITFPLYTGSAIENVSLAFDVNPDMPTSRLVSPRDFVFMGASGPVLDMDGHGTHVASTAAEQTNNSLLLAGVAYNTRVMPVKVCVGYWEMMIANAMEGRSGYLVAPDDGFCPDDAVAGGIRYAADNGAKVINLSLGGEGQSPAERSAILYAVSRGAFVSMSMGNDFENGNPTNYPAAEAPSIEGAMSVGAVGKSLTRAYYSSTGSYIEVVAPGGNDRDPGTGEDEGFIWQSTLLFTDQSPSLAVPRFDRYEAIGYEGTSMSAPHVAGLAALLMSQSSSYTPAVVEALVKATAKDLGAAGKDNDFGYGLIQPRAALFGFGIRK